MATKQPKGPKRPGDGDYSRELADQYAGRDGEGGDEDQQDDGEEQYDEEEEADAVPEQGAGNEDDANAQTASNHSRISQLILGTLRNRHRAYLGQVQERNQTAMERQKLLEMRSPFRDIPGTQANNDQDQQAQGGAQKQLTLAKDITPSGNNYAQVMNDMARNFAAMLQCVSRGIAQQVGGTLREEFSKQRQFMRHQYRRQEELNKRAQYRMDENLKFNLGPLLASQQDQSQQQQIQQSGQFQQQQQPTSQQPSAAKNNTNNNSKYYNKNAIYVEGEDLNPFKDDADVKPANEVPSSNRKKQVFEQAAEKRPQQKLGQGITRQQQQQQQQISYNNSSLKEDEDVVQRQGASGITGGASSKVSNNPYASSGQVSVKKDSSYAFDQVSIASESGMRISNLNDPAGAQSSSVVGKTSGVMQDSRESSFSNTNQKIKENLGKTREIIQNSSGHFGAQIAFGEGAAQRGNDANGGNQQAPLPGKRVNRDRNSDFVSKTTYDFLFDEPDNAEKSNDKANAVPPAGAPKGFVGPAADAQKFVKEGYQAPAAKGIQKSPQDILKRSKDTEEDLDEYMNEEFDNDD